MKAVLVFLGFAVACASAQSPQEPALKVKFEMPIPFINPNDGSKFFMPQPTTIKAAEEQGWQVTPHPEVRLCNIQLWCNPDDYAICVYFDKDTGNCAGIQINVPKNDLSELPYDLTVQGWVEWSPCTECETYMAQRLFVQSEEFLQQSVEDRLANYDPSSLIQDNTVIYSGFHGELHRVPADQDELERTTAFTKQACIPMMGRHYYYNMSSETECKADSLHPWFPLMHDNKMVGSGMMFFGKMATPGDGKTDCHEHPPKLAVQIIVDKGPECMYNMAEKPGVVTSHVYFVKNPERLGCLKN